MRRRTAEHAKEQDAGAPHVARPIVRVRGTLPDLAHHHLRRHERGRAAHGAHEVPVEVDDLAEAEVRDLHRGVVGGGGVQHLWPEAIGNYARVMMGAEEDVGGIHSRA